MFFWKPKPPPSFLFVWLTAAGVLVLKAIFILTTSIRGLSSTTWIIDDSIIEMVVARNVALGHGFSLDGIHATTGAPFLWIYLSSLNHLFLGKEGAMRLTFIETSVFGALAAIVVFYLALKLTEDRRVAWTAFILSTFTGNAFFNAMNGMDTALFTFLVLMAIATFFNVGRPKSWSNFRWGCVVGLWAGLACMTRGDGIFVIGSIGLLRLYEIWQTKKKDRTELIHSLAGIVLIWGICFAIFMGWQLMQTGSPFPANQVGRRELALAWQHFSFSEFSLKRYLLISGWNVFQLEDLMRVATGGSLLAFVALMCGLLQKRLRNFAIVSTVYIGVFFTLLVAYQWYFADFHGLRYINPAVHILFIFVAAFLWQLPVEHWKKPAAILITAYIVIFTQYKLYQLASRLPWAPSMSYIGRPGPTENKRFWSTIDWMKANLPAGTIVGVRDYGRVSMFTDIVVQDLAGNIDIAAAQSLNNGTLDMFLKNRHVQYLNIPSLQERSDKLYQYLHTHLTLEQVKDSAGQPVRRLYKIMW